MTRLQGEVTERRVSSSEVEYDEAVTQPLAVVVEGVLLRCSVLALWLIHASTSVYAALHAVLLAGAFWVWVLGARRLKWAPH